MGRRGLLRRRSAWALVIAPVLAITVVVVALALAGLAALGQEAKGAEMAV